MEKILLVEDSPFFAGVARNALESQLNFSVIWAKSYAEAESILSSDEEEYLAALVDLNLPDAPEGAAVDLILDHHIPIIVFTANLNDDTRDLIMSKNVVDYVHKEGRHNVDYLVHLIQRLHLNRSIKVLIVEDSTVSRNHLRKLLSIYNYQIYEATDGAKAMDVLNANPDIRLAVVDYHMPNMDGFEFTRNIRKRFGKGDLAIIGISAVGNQILSAQFLKFGANDFIHKPFINEEFHCRVLQNVEMIEHIQQIKRMSNLDYLTGLVNRRQFFEVGHRMFAAAQRHHTSLALAMIDIDNFKRINDRYGHAIGDQAIRQVAMMLNDRFRRSDIVSRFGGEEFCILAANMPADHAVGVFDALRKSISTTDLIIDNLAIRTTVSIGISCVVGENLDDMIAAADKMLYTAKNNGKDQVVEDPAGVIPMGGADPILQ